jgi:hypothetical protein
MVRRQLMKPATLALIGLALPVLVSTAVVVNQSLGERFGRGEAALPINSAEAAGSGNAAAMLRYMRAGEDPTREYPLRPEIISSSVLFATTLEAAMWSRQEAMFRLLDREGVIVGDDQRRFLACLAKDLDLPGVLEYLAPSGVECVEGEAQARVLARTTSRLSQGH